MMFNRPNYQKRFYGLTVQFLDSNDNIVGSLEGNQGVQAAGSGINNYRLSFVTGTQHLYDTSKDMTFGTNVQIPVYPDATQKFKTFALVVQETRGTDDWGYLSISEMSFNGEPEFTMQFDYENKYNVLIEDAGPGMIPESLKGYQFPGTNVNPVAHIHTDKITVENPSYNQYSLNRYPWILDYIASSESEKVFNQFRIEKTNGLYNVQTKQIQVWINNVNVALSSTVSINMDGNGGAFVNSYDLLESVIDESISTTLRARATDVGGSQAWIQIELAQSYLVKDIQAIVVYCDYSTIYESYQLRYNGNLVNTIHSVGNTVSYQNRNGLTFRKWRKSIND